MRFKLKQDFLTFARDQIRGGIWYKPSWWEAVCNVPPPAQPQRVRKHEIPNIRFVEDRLITEFKARNPRIKRFDEKAVSRGHAPDTVVNQFVKEQLRHMRNDVPQEAAYRQANAWLIEHGRSVLQKASPHKITTEVKLDKIPPAGIVERVMQNQAAAIVEAVTFAARAHEEKAEEFHLPNFRSPVEALRLRTRTTADSKDAVLPRRQSALTAVAGGAGSAPTVPQLAPVDIASSEEERYEAIVAGSLSTTESEGDGSAADASGSAAGASGDVIDGSGVSVAYSGPSNVSHEDSKLRDKVIARAVQERGLAGRRRRGGVRNGDVAQAGIAGGAAQGAIEASSSSAAAAPAGEGQAKGAAPLQ